VFANYLKVLTLALFAYVADAFFAGPDWTKALKNTVVPTLHLNASFITTLVAVFGTTISPYLFFWQASEEVEEMHRLHIERGDPVAIRRETIDVDVGMLIANVVFYFIVITTAATLYPAGLRDINSAREAAEALRPLAGDKATVLFALGFIGTGLSQSRCSPAPQRTQWRRYSTGGRGWRRSPSGAPQFYTVIAISTVIGLGIAASGVGAIQALFMPRSSTA
jgi:Mn2+/Fe2+ NRAMP family transporter